MSGVLGSPTGGSGRGEKQRAVCKTLLWGTPREVHHPGAGLPRAGQRLAGPRGKQIWGPAKKTFEGFCFLFFCFCG